MIAILREKFNGSIWRIIPDNYLHLLYLEIHHPDKTISFYCIDLINNQFIFKNLTLYNEFKLNLDKAYNGMVYFHGYENDYSPGHKGIIAYKSIDNRIAWENYNLSLYDIKKDGIVAFDSRITPRKFQLLDFETGKLLKIIDLAAYHQLDMIEQKIVYPENITDEINFYNSYQRLKFNDLEIKTLYKKANDLYHQIIQISKTDKLLLEEIINEDIRKLIFDTFFTWRNRLIVIKNKSEIVTYLV